MNLRLSKADQNMQRNNPVPLRQNVLHTSLGFIQFFASGVAVLSVPSCLIFGLYRSVSRDQYLCFTLAGEGGADAGSVHPGYPCFDAIWAVLPAHLEQSPIARFPPESNSQIDLRCDGLSSCNHPDRSPQYCLDSPNFPSSELSKGPAVRWPFKSDESSDFSRASWRDAVIASHRRDVLSL